MELFKDQVRLSQGVFLWHLRTDAKSLAVNHFKDLNEVEDYLDVCDFVEEDFASE